MPKTNSDQPQLQQSAPYQNPATQIRVSRPKQGVPRNARAEIDASQVAVGFGLGAIGAIAWQLLYGYALLPALATDTSGNLHLGLYAATALAATMLLDSLLKAFPWTDFFIVCKLHLAGFQLTFIWTGVFGIHAT